MRDRTVPEPDAAADGLERKLATILSADVAAYSRLMAEDEEQTLQTFRGHKEVFEQLVALHRGRIFNTAGDAILAEFGSAVEAVRCATEIQAALRTKNDQLPEGRRVKFRIGVNLGDVMVQGHDLLGDGVNIAARLQTAAEPGGICIAGSVYDQILNKLALSFKPLGEMSYKNIPQPVRTFAIAGADGLGRLPSPPMPHLPASRRTRIRVIAAAVLLVLAAGALAKRYAADHERNTGTPRAALHLRRHAAEARLAAEERAAEEASRHAAAAAQQQSLAEQQQAKAERQRPADETRRPAAAGSKGNAPAQLAAAAVAPPGKPTTPSAVPAVAAALPNPGVGGDRTGVYRGPICYAPGEKDGARCYRAQAVVADNTISGQWPSRFPGATMQLEGDVTPSGDVAIHMHVQRADGSRFAFIDLVGKLRDGRIDAAGSFRSGRHVTLSWRKD